MKNYAAVKCLLCYAAYSSMRLAFSLIAFFCACCLTWAQSPMTLEDCIRLAQSAPSNITVARLQREITRLGVTQAKANFLPGVGIDGQYIYNSPLSPHAGEFSFVAFNAVHEYQTFFVTNLELDTAGRLRALLARARADQAIASANLQIAQRDLRRLVSTAFYRLLLARHLVEVGRETLADAQQFEARTKVLLAGGEVAQADVIKASGSVAFLQQALSAAEMEGELANHDLASFWTENITAPLAVEDTLGSVPAAPPESQPVEAKPFLKRPEFLVLDAQRLGFLADRRRARANLLPQLNASYEYGVDTSVYSWNNRGYAAMVRLHIPVFDWFQTRNAMRQFRFQTDQVETDRQMAERTFARDYQDALARVRKTYEQIAITQNQVQLSEQNSKLAQIRYIGGEGLALDVVAAQSQLAQARNNYFVTLANHLNAKAELEVAAGR